MNNKSIFEILVDRQNIKWPWAFEHILITLHKIIDKKRWKFFFNTEYDRPHFSFEIAKIWNKIRFFIVVESKLWDFFKNQIYAHYSNVEIREVSDYLDIVPNDKIIVGELWLEKNYIYPINIFSKLQEWWVWESIDPYSSITAALSKTWNNTLNVLQINFSPIPDTYWKKNVKKFYKILDSNLPSFLKKLLISYKLFYLKIFLLPFYLILKLLYLVLNINSNNSNDIELPKEISDKLNHFWFWVKLNIISAWEDTYQSKLNLKEINSTLWIYWNWWLNWFKLKEITQDINIIQKVKNRYSSDKIVLSTQELSWLVHLPTSYVKTPWVNWVLARNFEPPANLPIYNSQEENDLTPIWTTNFRQEQVSFWIWPNDRRRHMYIIWKTWMWKSTLLENMIIDDIRKGRWVAVIDPHWDLAENVIWHIPKSRTNQTIIFDPSDRDWPIAFNMLDWVSNELKPLVASWLVSIFKKIFWDSWWPRLEYILRNIILSLIDYPNTTIISIPLMLTSDVYRKKVVEKIKDPVVKKFWTHEFEKMAPNQKVEASWPILNKVWQFLSTPILRNVLWQPKNSFSLRWAMDNQKIVIIKLSKWIIWEDASSLLWAMMVTKFQLDAMSRADIAEKERKDFYLYVDEFQNFATDSFATILSEARKYKLNLVMANQYIDQMTETVKWAVFWNVWSIASFQVWYHDSTILKEVMWWDITSEDLTNLKKYSVYLKQLIEWMPSKVFSADTFAPYSTNPEAFKIRYDKILSVSREKYSAPRDLVEQKINKSLNDLSEQEKKADELKEKLKQKAQEEKRKKHEESKN